MGQEEIHILTVVAKYILLPIIGFFAGFAVQWFLQVRKSRDDLLQALAAKRADALGELWAITTLRPEITSLKIDAVVSSSLREQANADIMAWYTQKGGALFLSWQATHLIFRLLDTLRDDTAQKNHLDHAVSALRTRLKFDCGMYSYSETKRQLNRPRPSPWPTNTTVNKDASKASLTKHLLS